MNFRAHFVSTKTKWTEMAMANMLSIPCFVCMLCCAGPIHVQLERPIRT